MGKAFKLRKGQVLVMKVVGPAGESHGDFRWPLTAGATVEAPDWQPTRECGRGLHGWLWGLGDLAASSRWSSDESRWLALLVDAAVLVDLDGKVKFPRCVITFIGDRTEVANFIGRHRPKDVPAPMFGQAAAGVRGQAAAGYAGQAAAGYAGQAAAGADGLATCGVGGIVRGGARAVLVALYALPGGHSYSVGQVGVAGVEADTWYEGSEQGLRRVGNDDSRVQQWDRAWALFEQRKAAREQLLADAAAKSRAAEDAARVMAEGIRNRMQAVSNG